MLTKNILNHQLQNYISHHAEEIEQQIFALQNKVSAGEMTIWNKEFNLLPSVVFIDNELHRNYATLVENYHRLLRKILVLYREKPEVRAYFSFSPLIESLCMLKPGYENEIVICRFDSYPTDSGFKILENNTDCPAGVLFTHHHRQAITSMPLIAGFLKENVKFTATTLNQKDEAFFIALLKAHEERTGSTIQHTFCILQIEGRISAEVQLMQRVLDGMGIHSIIADPRSLTYRYGKLCQGETVIDVIWNKINTCYFNELLVRPREVSALLKAVCENKVTHVNSFASRYITENKRSLALMKDPRFRHFFSDTENKLIEMLLPWACQASEDKINYKGIEDSAKEHARRNKDEFVLKMPYDIRGEGVIIGKDSTEDQWQDALKLAVSNKSILQEYIAVQQFDVYNPEHKKQCVFNMSLDFFMYDGEFAGFGSKLSKSLKVNIFQGGSKNIILPIM